MLGKINQIKQGLLSGSPSQFMNSLTQFSDITRSQYQAHRGQMQFQLKPMIDSLQQGFQILRKKISSKTSLEPYFKKIQNNIPKSYEKKYKDVFSRLTRQTKKAIVQNIAEEFRDQVADEIQKQLMKEAVMDQDVINMNLKRQQFSKSSFDTPIQQSIAPYQSIINSSISMVSPNQIPRSVQFLANFAKTQNKIPLGSASDMKGLSYVALQRVQRGDKIKMIPLPQNVIKNNRLPNLASQLSYHSNRTINSWNKFVQHQAQLVDFIGNISSRQKRLKYVQDQFKNLNYYTFSAEVLATLTYYYVYIPLEKFIRKVKIQSISPSQQNFYSYYSVASSVKQNPILLSNSAGKSLAKLLLNYNVDVQKFLSPPDLNASVIKQVLIPNKSSINKKQIEKINKYQQIRQDQANSFFTSNGLTKGVTQSLLAQKDFSGIKKKRFTFPDDLRNNQFVNIIQKISNDKTKNVKQKWDLTWGSQFLYCHDYIWGDQT